MRTRFGIVALVAFAAFAVLAAPGVATAASVGDGSAIDQYGEFPPGAGGKVNPNTKKKTTPLPRKSASNLTSVAPAPRRALTHIATDSRFGNPSASIGVVKAPPADNFQSSVGRSLRAAIVSPGSGSENRLVVLLIAIVGVTIALGIAAARRQRELNRR